MVTLFSCQVTNVSEIVMSFENNFQLHYTPLFMNSGINTDLVYLRQVTVSDKSKPDYKTWTPPKR